MKDINLTITIILLNINGLNTPIKRQRLSVWIEKKDSWGAWVAQSVKCPTLDFGSGHYLRILRSSPTLDSVLGVEPA